MCNNHVCIRVPAYRYTYLAAGPTARLPPSRTIRLSVPQSAYLPLPVCICLLAHSAASPSICGPSVCPLVSLIINHLPLCPPMRLPVCPPAHPSPTCCPRTADTHAHTPFLLPARVSVRADAGAYVRWSVHVPVWPSARLSISLPTHPYPYPRLREDLGHCTESKRSQRCNSQTPQDTPSAALTH